MAPFDRKRQFFVALDKGRPESRPGTIIGIYYDEWEAGRPVVEGWRGPGMDSEDFPRKSLEPYRCLNLVVDIGGYFDCFQGTIID